MAIQTKYEKDLQDGKIKPKPVVKTPVVKTPVVNTVRPPLPAAPKAPAGNPYQNIYAAPKAPVYSDRGADRIKALAPAPVKYTPQNLPVYRGAAPVVPLPAQLIKPPGPQGGKPGLMDLASNSNYAAQMSARMPAPNPAPTVSSTGSGGGGNKRGVDPESGEVGRRTQTTTVSPKLFDPNTSTLAQLGNEIARITGVPGQEKTLKKYQDIYAVRLQNSRDQLAITSPAAPIDYANTAEGVAAAQANTLAIFNAQTAAQTSAAAQAQINAMAQLDANNAAAERMAKLQYAQTPPVDRTEYNQMVDMYQALQQQMMTLQNSYIQALRDRDIPVVAPVVPPPATGPTPFVPPSFAPSPQTGAYAEFNDTGLGALNTMNPSNLQVLRQLMQARGYTGAGSQGRYGERTYARPGGSGALGISDADFENPLNYAGVAAEDRENAEAAMRWFLGQSGYSPQYAFPGMPSYAPRTPIYEMPPITY